MLNAVTAIWKFRYFLFALVRLDLRQRYKRSFLGLGWAIIHPAATAAAYVVVFGGVLAQSTPSYIVTLLIGLAVWGFIRESAVSGCLAIVSHESYVRQSPLPFGLYSLRFVLGYAIQAAFALGVAAAAVVWVDGHADKLLILWAVVPSLLLIFVAGWSVATLQHVRMWMQWPRSRWRRSSYLPPAAPKFLRQSARHPLSLPAPVSQEDRSRQPW